MQLFIKLFNVCFSYKTQKAVYLLCAGQKIILKNYVIRKIYVILHAKGALTQLARVSHWQCGSHRFESDMLHKAPADMICRCFFIIGLRQEPQGNGG